MAVSPSPTLFDRYIVELHTRAASPPSSLPPPPRTRTVSTPSKSPRPSTAQSMHQQQQQQQPVPVLRDPFSPTDSSNGTPTVGSASQATFTVRIDTEDDGSGTAEVDHASVSSLNSYGDLFYKPADVPISAVTAQTAQRRRSQSLDFPDEVSVEDYSDLLYPELQSLHGSMRSNRRGSENHLHGPPMRKRIPSFASHEGPESPVEFAQVLASPTRPVPEERRPSKIDRLLGLDSASSRKGSTDRLIQISETRRDSFIEFDTAPQILSALGDGTNHRSKSSISDEMPSFTVPRLHGSMSTQGDYIALVDAVDSKKGKLDTSQTLKSTQVLVDGSDKPQSPIPSLTSGRPSTENLLDQSERAELVRKNKKIAQVLGPGVVPAAQTKTRPVANGTNADPTALRRDALHRSARSETVGVDDPKWETVHEKKLRDAAARLEHKSSWSALDHDTIFLTGMGRRHSSPMADSFSINEADTGVNWDAASMSSLGSIIEKGGLLDKKERDDRSRSPTSFMEMSDDDGMKTPKRRPSVDTTNSKVEEGGRRSYERIASPSLKVSPPSTDDHEPRQSRHSIDSEEIQVSSIVSRRIKRKDTVRTKGSAASYLSLSDDEIDRHSWKGDPKSDTWRVDRQRKREKLAKIHRYLGSKVPAELVLGYSSSTSPPPAVKWSPTTPKATKSRWLEADSAQPSDGVKAWKRRRRSSSAAMYRHWESGPKDMEHEVRTKDTLTETERLREIKRAQKIEQIFGEQPPRRASLGRPATAPISRNSPSSPPRTPMHRSGSTSMDQPYSGSFSKGKKPKSPTSASNGRPSTSGSSRPSTSRSTTGLITSYNKEQEREKRERVLTGLAEDDINFSQTIQIPAAYFPVGTALGSPWEDVYDSDVLDISRRSIQEGRAPIMPGVRTSRQFLDYRNSLNTLGRILDQDDRQSLNELHAVLDSDDDAVQEADIESVDPYSLSASRSSTHRARDFASAKRQRPLQPRASMSSINTVATSSTFQTLTPEPMAFQARRKRAAKLTHFFGATYRDLFGEVLNRIERGMLEEARQGEMSQDEMKHLMKQLERLKTRQSQLS